MGGGHQSAAGHLCCCGTRLPAPSSERVQSAGWGGGVGGQPRPAEWGAAVELLWALLLGALKKIAPVAVAPPPNYAPETGTPTWTWGLATLELQVVPGGLVAA